MNTGTIDGSGDNERLSRKETSLSSPGRTFTRRYYPEQHSSQREKKKNQNILILLRCNSRAALGLLGSQAVYISAVRRRDICIGAASVYDSQRERWVCTGVAASSKRPPPIFPQPPPWFALAVTHPEHVTAWRSPQTPDWLFLLLSPTPEFPC